MKARKSHKKTKFSITLDGWTAAVLQEAVELELKKGIGQYHLDPESKYAFQFERNRLIRIAIEAVCGASVKNGIILPGRLGFEITKLDPEVESLLDNYPGDGPTGLADMDEGDRTSPRWLVE